MTFHAQDDQALRLFRAAHADFSYRAETARCPDSMLEALIAHVIDDTVRNAVTAGAARAHSHAPVSRELYLGIHAA